MRFALRPRSPPLHPDGPRPGVPHARPLPPAATSRRTRCCTTLPARRSPRPWRTPSVRPSGAPAERPLHPDAAHATGLLLVSTAAVHHTSSSFPITPLLCPARRCGSWNGTSRVLPSVCSPRPTAPRPRARSAARCRCTDGAEVPGRARRQGAGDERQASLDWFLARVHAYVRPRCPPSLMYVT